MRKSEVYGNNKIKINITYDSGNLSITKLGFRKEKSIKKTDKYYYYRNWYGKKIKKNIYEDVMDQGDWDSKEKININIIEYNKKDLEKLIKALTLSNGMDSYNINSSSVFSYCSLSSKNRQ